MSITRISDRQQREQDARAYHPSAWQPIWTPHDSVDTAQAFHAELAQAERGVAVVEAGRYRRPHLRIVTAPKVASKSRLFSVSRERKARIMDGLAVALLLALAAILGCLAVLASAPKAKADSDYSPRVFAFAATYGGVACEVLDAHDSVPGLIGVMSAISDQGFTDYEAGQIVGIAVTEICPRHTDLLELFVDRYGTKTSVA